ncbi:MAG: hypothetical protein IT445_16420 [Phycisphaeraceae bacterium]|nr:hypothetical protein [Phycisphaeraceae bacterium]
MHRHPTMIRWLSLCLLVLPLKVAAQDFSGVPGAVINYEEAPLFFEPKVYLSTPSITIMPNGDYFVSNDYFGSGTSENTIKVFRSTDKGQTWTYQSTVGGFWSTIFQHNGDLYIWGYREGGTNGDILIRKSTDNGLTWTNPTDANNGLLRDGDYGGTANSPVIYNGRIWIAQSGTRVMSAPADSNLLLASSWTLSSAANVQSGPLGSGLTVTEAQVVASPQTGVVTLPKVGNLPYTVLLRATSPSTLASPAAADWVSLPGGEKKFGAMYDAVSGKFYILDNPVLDVHKGVTTDALTRTAAAMLSSTDLINWNVEKFFLFTPNIDNGTYGEGFQYFNFAIDGDDLAVASRTAFVVPGENLPPRGHDSNLITFHSIEDFRTATPDQYLKIESGKVTRYERTQHMDAPLGNFALGATFAGAAITLPNGVAQDSNGDVYIRETAGRILRFDALGNFIETVTSAPVAFNASQTDVTQPAAGENAWRLQGSGNWFDTVNWYYWGRADTGNEIANFGSAIGAAATISLDRTFTVKGLRFRSPHAYTIGGTGSLIIKAATGNGVLAAQQGHHEIQRNILLDSDTDADLAAGSSLTLTGQLNLNGQALNISGTGSLNFDPSTLVMAGGTLNVINGNTLVLSSPLTVTSGSTLSGDGTVVGSVWSYGQVAPGQSPGTLHIQGTFAQFASASMQIELAAAAHDQLTVTGNVLLDGSLELVPEPGFNPDYGDNFDIITSAGIFNAFAAIEGVIVNSNLALAVTYSATTVTVTAALPGDANLDGTINLSDLQILGDNWQSSSANWIDADFNGDRLVNLADLQIIGDHWNASAGDFDQLAAAYIPEPAAVLLLTALATGLLARRNRSGDNE